MSSGDPSASAPHEESSALVSSAITARLEDARRIAFDNELPHSLGSSFNPFDFSITNELLTVSEANIINTTPVGGFEDSYIIRVVDSKSQLREVLDLSASAEVSSGLNKAKGKYEYYRSVSIDESSILLHLERQIVGTTEALKDFSVTEPAHKFIEEYGWNAYIERFGFQFVSGRVFGAWLVVGVAVRTFSRADKEEVTKALKLSAGNYSIGAEGEAKAKQSLSTQVDARSFDLTVRSSGPLSNISAISEVLPALREFGTHVDTKTMRTQALLLGSIESLFAKPPHKTIKRYKSNIGVYEAAVGDHTRIDDLRRTWTLVRSNPELFKLDAATASDSAIKSITALDTRDKAVVNDIETIAETTLDEHERHSVDLEPYAAWPERIQTTDQHLTLTCIWCRGYPPYEYTLATNGQMTSSGLWLPSDYEGFRFAWGELINFKLDLTLRDPELRSRLRVEYRAISRAPAGFSFDTQWLPEGTFILPEPFKSQPKLRPEEIGFRLVGELARDYKILWTCQWESGTLSSQDLQNINADGLLSSGVPPARTMIKGLSANLTYIGPH